MMRHQAEVAGRRLAWLQAGQGRPVVLLHAFPVNADMWQPQLEAVPHGWRLIAPDLPGFGDSRGGPPATTVDDHADAVLALLRHLEIEQAAIGGISMGGYITFALYRKAPQRFRAAILANTRADADNAEARAARQTMKATVQARGAAAAAEIMVPRLLGPHAGDPALGPRVRDMILRNETQAIVDAIDVLATRPDSTTTLTDITVPTLVVAGDRDDVTPVPLAESMVQRLAHATFTVIPDAPHLSSVQQPNAFNRALWDFLGVG